MPNVILFHFLESTYLNLDILVFFKYINRVVRGFAGGVDILTLRVLKDDLLRTGIQFLKTFQSLIKESIKKGLTNLIEVLTKRI